MKYNVAFKHLEKIAKSASQGRPILQGIHHVDNQVRATDAHRLLAAKVDKVKFKEHVLNPKTGKELDGAFPDTDQLTNGDRYDSKKILLNTMDIKLIRDMLKVAKTMKFELAVIKASDKKIVLETTVRRGSANFDEVNKTLEKLTLSYVLSENEANIEDEYCYYPMNINYVLDAFEFMYDTQREAVIKLNGRMTPIHFVSEDYTYLILPVREY